MSEEVKKHFRQKEKTQSLIGIATVWLGSTPNVIITDFDLMREAFITHGEQKSPLTTKVVKRHCVGSFLLRVDFMLPKLLYELRTYLLADWLKLVLFYA